MLQPEAGIATRGMSTEARALVRLARVGDAAALAVVVCAAWLDAQAAVVPRSVTLAGSAVPFTSQTASQGNLSSARTLTIQMSSFARSPGLTLTSTAIRRSSGCGVRVALAVTPRPRSERIIHKWTFARTWRWSCSLSRLRSMSRTSM